MEIYASSRNFEEYGVNQTQWEEEYKDLITSVEPPHGIIDYTFYTIKLQESDYNWLKVNTHFIEYKASSENIENEHLIGDNIFIQNINNEISNNHFFKANVNELITMGCQFDVDSYQEYMSFFLSSENRLSVNLANDFSAVDSCFSFPLFKYILANNAESDPANCFFTFVNAENNGYKTIAFKVNFSDGNKKYYDFTHDPM